MHRSWRGFQSFSNLPFSFYCSCSQYCRTYNVHWNRDRRMDDQMDRHTCRRQAHTLCLRWFPHEGHSCVVSSISVSKARGFSCVTRIRSCWASLLCPPHWAAPTSAAACVCSLVTLFVLNGCCPSHRHRLRAVTNRNSSKSFAFFTFRQHFHKIIWTSF